MLTKITKVIADWIEVKNECRNTINKEYSDKPVTENFKKKLLISEHSPIRLIEIKWRWQGIKSWISVHFARHWLGWDKWISTQRDDRTGIDRNKSPQDTLVNYDGKGNAQACINVARYRLCNCSHPETRRYMEDFKISLKEYEPELSDVLVPNCIYRSSCPEFNMCEEKFYANFLKWCKENNKTINTIQSRYDAYNEFFLIKDEYIGKTKEENNAE